MRKLGSVINTRQFNRETIEELFEYADIMEKSKRGRKTLNGKIMAVVFYEPSTRTRLSFEAAMHRLGGRVIGTENAKEFSSKAKGESLEDSIRVVSEYVDIIVLRYHKEGGAQRAQKFSKVPIINAGDGTGEHPTQALLDTYTIKKRFGSIENLSIAMVGDLANGRTVRSLSCLLANHYPKNKIYFISPEAVKMRDDIKSYLNGKGIKWEEGNELKSILPEIDVVYQTRVQRERFQDDPELFEKVVNDSKKLIINEDCLNIMKPNSIIMHPLPRQTEISYAVDNNARAFYFQQAGNGLYIRMALLTMIINGY